MTEYTEHPVCFVGGIQNDLLGEIARFLRYIKKRTGVSCCVAGGFIRDATLGVKPRDIDLYVLNKGWALVGRCVGGSDPALGEYTSFTEADEEYRHQSIDVRQTLRMSAAMAAEFPLLTEYEIDLIGLLAKMEPSYLLKDTLVQRVVDNFNIGISQTGVGFNQTGDILRLTSSWFDHDVVDHCFTVLRTDWGFEFTAKNLEKLRMKFGNWPIFTHSGVEVTDLDAFRNGMYDTSEEF